MGLPLTSCTPIIIYPLPQLSRSFANAHIVFKDAAGSQVCFNSILAHSTTSPDNNVLILVGIAI